MTKTEKEEAMEASPEQMRFIADLARECGRSEAEYRAAAGVPPYHALSVDQARAAIGYGIERRDERHAAAAQARAAELAAARAAAPEGTVRVVVPARGNDLKAPSHSHGYYQWRFLGESKWRSGLYEGRAVAALIQVQGVRQGKGAQGTKDYPLQAGRISCQILKQPYELLIEVL